MGRIKTTMIKRVSNKLMREKRDEFCDDFESNKKKVGELLDIKSKKIRNIISGYITKLSKNKKKKKKQK